MNDVNVSQNNIATNKSFVNSSKSLFLYTKSNWMLYFLLIAPMAFLFLFSYRPMYGLIIAFKDYDVIRTVGESKWIGLDIFKEIFKSNDFYKVLRNTLILNSLDLIAGFPAPIILAIIINEVKAKWFKKVSQTLLYMPHFLSWVIISGIMYQLLSPQTGLLNLLINRLGGTSIPFLTDKLHWVISYNAIGIWQGAGWGTIIYLAAITSINSELYEAAIVDGAGRLRKIWHITLPGIRPTIVVLLIINLGRIMNSGFDRAYTLMNPLVMDYADVISTYVYRVGLQSSRYNLATAVGLFQSVVGFTLVLLANFIAKRSGEQGIF